MADIGPGLSRDWCANLVATLSNIPLENDEERLRQFASGYLEAQRLPTCRELIKWPSPSCIPPPDPPSPPQAAITVIGARRMHTALGAGKTWGSHGCP